MHRLCLACAIVLCSSAALDADFFRQEFERNGSYKALGDKTDVIASNLAGYFLGGKLNPAYYSQRETLHLTDVRNLLWAFLAALVVCATVSLAAVVQYLKSPQRMELFHRLFAFSGTAALAFGLLLLLLGLWFDRAFTLFHRLLFSNDYWLLSEGDTLIVLFPREFWVSFFRRAVVLIMQNSLFMLAVSLILRLCRLCRSPLRAQ